MLQTQVSIVRGDDYFVEDGRAFIFSLPFSGDTPDLTEATIRMDFFPQANVPALLSITGVIQNGRSNSQQAVFELSAADTALLTSVNYTAGIIASLSEAGTSPDHVVTIMRVLVTTYSGGG